MTLRTSHGSSYKPVTVQQMKCVCVSSGSQEMMFLMNSTSPGPLELLMRNSSSLLTEDPAAAPKDSFSNALTKNIMAMLVWLVLSIINISMVHTFLRHRYRVIPAVTLKPLMSSVTCLQLCFH